MAYVTYFTDTEGQIWQQLALLERNQPAIQLSINHTIMPISAALNLLKSHGPALPTELLKSIHFHIPPDHCLVFGGDGLDATGPQGDRRDRLMAALLANTHTFYASHTSARFLLVADNRTTNKLSLGLQLDQQTIQLPHQKFIIKLSEYAAELQSIVSIEALETFWNDNAHAFETQLTWPFIKTNFHNSDEISNFSAELARVHQLFLTEQRDIAAMSKFYTSYNAPNAVEAWQNEGGTIQSYRDAVMQGDIGTIIKAQRVIQLIPQPNDKYLVFVHGGISPLTFRLAYNLRSEFKPQYTDLDIYIKDLRSLANFFNTFYTIATLDYNVSKNTLIYQRLKSLIGHPEPELNNLGTPFTTSYKEVEAQLFDPTIEDRYKVRYYAAMQQAAVVFSGHTPLAGGGIQLIKHPDGNETRIILGDNSKLGLCCHTFEPDTDTLRVHTSLGQPDIIERRYTASTWQAPYLGLNSRELAKTFNRNIGETETARVIYWDSDSQTYTVACTAKLPSGAFINEVHMYTAAELSVHFPYRMNRPQPQDNPLVFNEPVAIDSAIHFYPPAAESSSSFSSGLFKAGLKFTAAAGVALILTAGISAIALGILMLAGSHGVLSLPALILMQQGISSCAACLGMSSGVLLGSTYLTGGLLLGLSLHSLKKLNNKKTDSDFFEPNMKQC